MDKDKWALVVEAMGINAEIEGMKAENTSREQDMLTLAYDDKDFVARSNDLYRIANLLRK